MKNTPKEKRMKLFPESDAGRGSKFETNRRKAVRRGKRYAS